MMIEMELAKTLFKLCFCGGFAVALLLNVLVLGVFFAARLWTLRDELKEMGESFAELLKALEKEEED